MFYKIYSIIMWTILCGIIFGIIQNKKYSSKKIEFWYLLSFSFLFLSFVMRIYMFLGIKLQYLYLFKHIYYLNYLGNFIAIFTSIFIFLRSNTLKFDYIKICMAVCCIIYMVFICTSSVRIKLHESFGYTMIIEKVFYMDFFICIFSMIIIFIAAYILKHEYKDRIGALLIMIYAIMQLFNVIMKSHFINMVDMIDICIQMLVIVIMNYSIFKFKKNRY